MWLGCPVTRVWRGVWSTFWAEEGDPGLSWDIFLPQAGGHHSVLPMRYFEEKSRRGSSNTDPTV